MNASPPSKTITKNQYIIGPITKSDAISSEFTCNEAITNEKYVMKCILKQTVMKPKNFKRMLADIELVKKIDSPYIIKIIDSYELDDMHTYIIPSYNNTLDKYIRDHGFLDPKEALRIFIDLVTAINELNTVGIKNIDLRPENIMFDENLKPVNCRFS